MYHPLLRVRHLFRLSADFVAYAVVNRAWGVPALTLLV
ncbi:MAG: hypothetical protein QOD76_2169, partial [Solirubrobacteraceae bacterium]|nr:hypothetical protein [Solirubrobacteraceae bacterium]